MDKDPSWNTDSWQQKKHLSPYWKRYDHGFAWLEGKDKCPACGQHTTIGDALFYFDEKHVQLVDLKTGLTNLERLVALLKTRGKLHECKRTC